MLHHGIAIFSIELKKSQSRLKYNGYHVAIAIVSVQLKICSMKSTVLYKLLLNNRLEATSLTT